MLSKLTFRRVQSKDISLLLKLFKTVFKKKISEEFYNWRYYNKNYSSFVALYKNNIIAHIGFVEYKFNLKSNYIFSRHSTFVIPEFQKKGVYYKLLKYSFSKIKIKSNYVIAWPNLKNLESSKRHDNFKVINTYNLFYKINFVNKKNFIFTKVFENYLKKLKFTQKNHLFFRDKKFIDWRYNTYQKDQFFFLDDKKLSHFIFQKKYFNNIIYYLIIDYYGNYLNYEKEMKLVLKLLLKNKINFQVLISSTNKKFNSFFQKEKIKKNNNKFYVGLYKIGNNVNLKKNIEKKIINDVKITDTDVFIETF
jgi:hypothetical protein